MRTTTPLQKEAPKTAVTPAGKATTNPLQRKDSNEKEPVLQTKSPPLQVVQKVSHDKVLEIAKEQNITTLGNTKEEIVQAIKEIFKITDKEIDESTEKEMQMLLETADEQIQDKKNKEINEEIEVKKKLETNSFRVTAGLKDYELAFGKEFSKNLTELKEEDRWLDGGAGLGMAVNDHYENKGKGKTTAVGYKIPAAKTNEEQQVVEKLAKNDKFKYLSGAYFSEMEEKEELEKGKTNIISDFNGVLSYTQTLSEDLNKYLRILKVGGRLYTNFRAKIYEGETLISELDWIKKDTRDDLDVIFIPSSYSIVIEKKKEGAAVKTLSFVKQDNIKENNMPQREYKIA